MCIRDRLNIFKERYADLKIENTQEMIDLTAEYARSMGLVPYYLYPVSYTHLGCGQGCVKGVSAFFDHIQACLGSQGLGGADHSPAAVDKTAAGRIAVLERVKMKIHEISSLS